MNTQNLEKYINSYRTKNVHIEKLKLYPDNSLSCLIVPNNETERELIASIYTQGEFVCEENEECMSVEEKLASMMTMITGIDCYMNQGFNYVDACEKTIEMY